MPKISVDAWRTRWREHIPEPDERDHDRERVFLKDHARYGATIHRHTADVLAQAASRLRIRPAVTRFS